MRYPLLASLVLLSCALSAMAGDEPGACRVYVGTYTGGGCEGIYTFTFDTETGAPGPVSLAAATENPSFLALHPAKPVLYACGEMAKGGTVSAFRRASAAGRLTRINDVSSEGAGPCHVAVSPSGRHVAVANYRGGSMALFPVAEGGGLKPACATRAYTGQGAHPKRQKAPHAHAVNFGPEGNTLYVTDLGTDRIHIYRYDAEPGTLEEAEPPAAHLAPGAGPRHLALHPSGQYAYVVNELGNTVTAFTRNGAGGLTSIQTIGTLPDTFTGDNTTAEIVLHPNGRFLYASNRGHDSIVAYAIAADTGRLRLVGHAPTGGKTPRNFNIDPAGRFLLAANQDSGSIAVFRINSDAGTLKPTGVSILVPRPVCVVFAGGTKGE